MLLAAVAWTLSLGWAAPQASPQAAAAQAGAAQAGDQRGVVDKYCVTCHNARLKTAGLSLERASIAGIASHPDVWEKVIRKVRAGMMPPPGMPQPDPESRRALVGWLETSLDRAARTSPNPGRPLVHRLNRAEYANAIRDLLALEVDATSLLPPDDSSAGFDNNADVLGVSPVLLESYLTAAERISALALGDPSTPPAGELFRVRQDESQDRHVPGLPLGTVGGLLIERTLPLDGEYQFQVRLFRTNLGTMRGLEYPHQLEISVDGERVHLASFGGDKEIAASSDNPTTTGDDVDGRFTARVPLKAGPRRITVAFLEKTQALNTRRLQNYVRSSSDTIDFSGYPHIDEVILTGPFKPTGAGRHAEPAPHLRRASPTTAADEERVRATDPVDAGAPRLSRRRRRRTTCSALLDVLPPRPPGRRHASTRGIDLALRRMLASPKFVFRVERDPRGRARRAAPIALSRSRAGVAAVVLPVEQHPGRRAAGRWPPQGGCSSAGDARAAGAPDAGATRSRRRSSTTSSGSGCSCATCGTSSRTRTSSPTSTTTCGARLQTETELFFASIMREDRSVARPDDGRLHVRQRAAGAGTTAFPTSTAATSAASR